MQSHNFTYFNHYVHTYILKSSQRIIKKKKNMYKGNKLQQSSIIHKSMSSATLLQTTNQVIQRDIDNYTRLLQQDKRKFFRVQENRNQVFKQYAKKNKELESLKGKQFQNETFKLKSEAKILERELDQSINSYNDVLASNKNLKIEIDELRKEKLNQKDVMKKLTSKIEEYKKLINSARENIQFKKESIEQKKGQILKIRAQNQSENMQFLNQVSAARGNLGYGCSYTQFKRKSQIDQKNQSTDTQPLIRYRLRHLLARNKQKVKIIENYQKTMEAIRKSFEEIKQESGVGELEEITQRFLKQEQQNHFIYEYIGKLGRQIEDLNDSIGSLKQRIDNQKEINQNYVKQLGTNAQKQKKKLQKNLLEDQCKKSIENLQNFMSAASKELKVVGCDNQLNKLNLAQQLAKIQSLIDQNFSIPEQQKTEFRQEVTRYTKGPPVLIQQLKENRQQKILDSQKLRQFASDYWQKKKAKPENK